MSPRSAIRVVVVLLLVGSVVAAFATRDGALAKVGEVHPGFFIYPNGFLAPLFLDPDSARHRAAGLGTMDLVVEIDGAPVRDGREAIHLVAAKPEGTPITYTLRRPDGREYRATIPSVALKATTLKMLFDLFAGAGLVLATIASVAAFARPSDRLARLFFVLAWAEGTNFGALGLDYMVVHRFTPWSFSLGTLAIAAFAEFALSFPEPRWPLSRYLRATRAVLYGLPAALLGIFLALYLRNPGAAYWFSLGAVAGHLVAILLLLANVLWTYGRSKSALARQRARVVLLGPGLLVVTTVAAAYALGFAARDLPTLAILMCAGSLPLAVAYSIFRHNLFEFDAFILRGVAIGASIVMGSALFAGLFAVIHWVTGADALWVAGGLVVVLASAMLPALAPLQGPLERWIDVVLRPWRQEAIEIVRKANRSLAYVRDQEAVVRILEDAARAASHAETCRVLAGPIEADFSEIGGTRDRPGFRPADPIAIVIRHGTTVNLDATSGRAAGVSRAARKRLRELGARLLVPFPSGRQYTGALLLGPRTDGRLYTRDDENLLESLAVQAAIALDNGRAWDELQNLQKKIAQENVFLRREIEVQQGFEEIIGSSRAVKQVLAEIEQVAPTDASVLVVGETGTGKELVVRALHRLSARADRALVKIACAAIPETLLESELFGHERGAFTGATTRQVGRFELADRGTIFFDDVDTLPLALQAKLLRAIQEGEVQRLGSASVRRVDVRVVAATNRDLRAEVGAGRFREDLYYRLNVVPLQIPPLRERKEDIPLLIQHFVERESLKIGRPVRPIGAATLDLLEQYDWPGNVRELRNAIERAVVMSRGDVIELPGALDGSLRLGSAPRRPAQITADGRPMAERVREFKLELIRSALEAASGNQSRAADLLGLHRQSLSRTMRELGLAGTKD